MLSDSELHLIDFLPAIYRESPSLTPFLEAFEPALFAPAPTSLEQRLAAVPSYLDADDTPGAFLEWLSQWAAVSLYREAPDPRALLREIVPLYRSRGTRRYVERMLELYVTGTVRVTEEDLPGIALGISGRARVGIESRLGEDPFQFSVHIDFAEVPASSGERTQLQALARRVIDLAKPAYTHYRLTHNLFGEKHGFVVAVHATLGVDAYLYPKTTHSSRKRHV